MGIPSFFIIFRSGRGLRQGQSFQGSSEDPDSRLGQVVGNVEGRLSAELDDHALGLFLFIDAEHVLHGEGFEIEFIRCIVIRRDGFGVAVHHDGLKSLVPQCEGRMDAAVIEFDAPGRSGSEPPPSTRIFLRSLTPTASGHCKSRS